MSNQYFILASFFTLKVLQTHGSSLNEGSGDEMVWIGGSSLPAVSRRLKRQSFCACWRSVGLD